MPEAFSNTIEGIKDGIDVSWRDKEKNYVWLWIFNKGNDHPETLAASIVLRIRATTDPSFMPEELRN